MSAPYTQPGDGKQNAGWNVPQAGYVQPGYPTQPLVQPGYPTQPQPGYPVQPGYPPQGNYPAPPPPYMGAQPGYNQPAYNVSSPGAMYQPGAPPPQAPKPEEGLPASFGDSFGDKAIRHAFVRKVYLILLVQMLVTFGFVSLFTFHTPTKLFVQRNAWVVILSYVVFIITYISLVCCSGLRRKYPANVIMLSIFTVAMSYMTGAIASTYDTSIVVMTVGITAAICFLITLFASQTKYDFTGCGIYLFVAGMVLFIFGIIAIFTYSDIMRTMYSAGIALLFSMYLIYDTQMILGGRKNELSPEEHIFAALCLYLDVINIFLALLSLTKN